MKLNIINISLIVLISITTTGCFKKDVIPTPVNSYAIEKSAYYKHDSINDKIINETSALYMSYPFSMKILLLSDEAIPALIPLSDKGVMSENYYLNAYIEEQNLIYEMFKKRKSFTKLGVEYVNKVNNVLNNKNYDFVMYFDTTTVGELDIYLKDTSTNRTFLIWKDGMTKIDPIQAVENILKSKMLYSSSFKNKNIQLTNSSNTIKNKSSKNKLIKNINCVNTSSKTKRIQNVNIINESSRTENAEDSNTYNTIRESVPKIKDIQNIDTINENSRTENVEDSKSYNTARDSSPKTKDIDNSNYYNAKRDSNGCYAYDTLNQCLVW